MKEHVIFYNRFVSLDDLKEFIGATDIYLTPYLNEAQITSGTLAYVFGAGKAVVSTPYWHAQELLADGRGVLVPFRDPGAIAEGVCALLDDRAPDGEDPAGCLCDGARDDLARRGAAVSRIVPTCARRPEDQHRVRPSPDGRSTADRERCRRCGSIISCA